MYRRLYFNYYKARASVRRRRRLIFASPAELRLIVLMGGQVRQIHWLRDPGTSFPFAIVLSRGKLFRAEKVSREVRVGAYYLDFGNDIGRAIEIDGYYYHMNVVADFERDAYLSRLGWKVMRIPAYKLWADPDIVRSDIERFLIL